MSLSKEKMEYIKDLYCRGFSYHDITERCKKVFNISISDDCIRYHCKRKFQKKLSMVEKLELDGVSKVLCLSDIHCPHFDKELVYGIVEKHKDEISSIVFNGDIIDCAEISNFPAVGKIEITEEMLKCHEMLKHIEQIAPDIPKFLIKGNHEVRWEKYLATNETPLVKLHSTNILSEIVKGFDVYNHQNNSYIQCEPLTNYTIIDNWYMLYKDTIFCHPISFSKVKGKVATMAIEYFIQQDKKFSNIFVAHTHKTARIKYYGIYGIEQGCLCKEMKYSNNGKLTYTPQDLGYALCVFKDGKLDINETRCYLL